MSLTNLHDDRIWPVILSGGSGTRLWPLSRRLGPKQFLAFSGAESMISVTAGRVSDAGLFHPAMVVTGEAHTAIIQEQLGNSVSLVVEPVARNTAPAIALAMLAVERQDPDGVMLVMPSDHQVMAPGVLLEAVRAAAGVAREGWLVTFGIRAATPETGYGYIRAGNEIGDGVCKALEFIEKPELARAEAFVADGGYSWNSGIFLFSVRALRAAFMAHAPAVLAAVEAGGFAAAPSISIDHAVFEHAERIAVCPVDPGWSDIGSWDALHGLGPGDAVGNVVSGRVESVDTRGCLLRADGVVLTTIGVNDLNIIATPDAVLVTARGRSQEVRAVTARLSGAVLERSVVQRRVFGDEWIVHDGEGVRVRRLVINDGAAVATGGSAGVMLLAGSALADGQRMVEGVLVQGCGVVSGSVAATILLFD